VKLVPVSPFYRLSWPDGTNFDYSGDDAQLGAEIARLSPEDVAGYRRFLKYSEGVYREGYEKLGHVAFLDFGSMVRAAPALMKYQAWRSVYSMVSHYVKNEKLRQALSFHTLLVGGNPMTTSAIYALIHKLERDSGVWFAQGGTNRLVAGMVRHFERLGGVVRLGDAGVGDPHAGRSRDRRAYRKRLRVRSRCGREQRRHRPQLSQFAQGFAQRPAHRFQPRAEALLAVACSSSISGCAAASRRSRTIRSCSARAIRGCSRIFTITAC
jgi:phytoene desaturase